MEISGETRERGERRFYAEPSHRVKRNTQGLTRLNMRRDIAAPI
jgi:ribosomal protein S21